MGFVLTGFSDEIDSDIIKQFEHLQKLGIEYFEPRGINGKNISDLNDEDVQLLISNMKKYGIKASSIGSPIGKIGINDDFESHLKKLEHVIRIAKSLGTKYIRVFSFYIPEGEEPERYKDAVIQRMKEMVKLAKRENVILLHENEKGIYGDIAPRCKDIFDGVQSENLRAVFDPANFIQCGQAVYPDAFDLLKPYIEYIHIKDAKSDGSVVPSGYGEGRLEDILKALKQSGYDGFLSLEPHLGSFKGLESLEENDDMLKLEGSTPEKFTLAFNSLKKILDRI